MSVKSTVNGGMVDLSDLATNFSQEVLAGPMDALGDRLAARMKSFCPVGATGDLQASISKKTQVYAKKNKVVGIVGPRRKAKGMPTRYAALVEFGHIAGGIHAGGKHIPARPFVRPTAAVARAEGAGVIGGAAPAALTIAVKRAKRRQYGQRQSSISSALV